jgi:outer membrane murein-binding lipoprotein Lpp
LKRRGEIIMARNNRSGRNNNPSGRNQYSSDWMDTVKERPVAAAAIAAASVGAGVFLWSKRNQISSQLSNLSDQISDWTESMRSDDTSSDFETMGADAGSTSSGAATGSTSSRTSRSTGSRPTTSRARTGSGSGAENL